MATNSDRIKATLEGQTLWAVRRLQRLLGKSESGALTWLIDRWLLVDQVIVERWGLGVEDYEADEPVDSDESAQEASDDEESV